ncbi:MAG TPA: magnesium transporter CorA family protein [Acidimicrobiales bacterium]|nr:magnesium transporter CorA family protein [Acidimicrobiales bacterium]
MASTRAYRDGTLIKEDFPVADISDVLEMPDTVVWVDYCRPTEDDLEELQAELGFHELAVQDALGGHQRPKLDHYPSHEFLVMYSVSLHDGRLIAVEIDAFIHPRWLVTVRKDEGFDLGPLLERWDRSRDLAHHGVGFLVYGLIDTVIDQAFATLDEFDQFYDDVSDSVFSEESPIQPSAKWFEMRRALIQFHRLVVPTREAVSALMRRDHNLVDEDLYPYYQDVYDHILRITESTDALRDLVSTIVETNLSLRDFRTNQIMKKVTSWAAIIAVPTLITGWYGMNVPYPGFAKHWGVLVSVILIFGCAGVLYWVFKRKDWL